ncbi:winged helix-turn-helix transcriptional regulator [Pedobacter steynii]|uniref:HxlR family transcriptional regulator n=1 Tax=Pedobacter steynii TaxID=430522 RepID=A0A1D7QKY2_9SPHI|nr:helix-turn-helix domain-containing protein [Pedobacter steynii]AOM79328.1 HxlR family transcriptional regulator [Pedobacter steynii]
MTAENETPSACAGSSSRAVRDALDVLTGKWKLPILMAISIGAIRFRKIANEIPGITDKMLSKELKDLEINRLIERTVLPTFPPTVEYSLTRHGRTLDKVIAELSAWGAAHRKEVTGN